MSLRSPQSRAPWYSLKTLQGAEEACSAVAEGQRANWACVSPREQVAREPSLWK